MRGGGPHKSNARRAHRGFILAANGFLRTSSCFNIALEPALKAEIVWCIDIHAQLIERQQLRVVEGKKALDQQKRAGLKGLSAALNACVCGEVINGPFNGVTRCQR